MVKRELSDFIAQTKELERNEQNDVYIFCSYDIVESTYLKTIRNDWIDLIKQFYDNSKTYLEKYGFEFWKYIGDEVLLYKKLVNEDLKDIHLFPERLFKVMNIIQESLFENFPETRMFLALKGTMWIAHVTEFDLQLSKTNNLISNIAIKQKTTSSYNPFEFELLDFLGKDVDLGFRISKYSIKNQLVVSAEFVKLHDLISKRRDSHIQKEYLSNYRFLKQIQLKGIWHKRDYPIILYRTDWEENNNIFEYDEKKYSIEMLSDNVSLYLDTVFTSIGKMEEITSYIDIIEAAELTLDRRPKIESPVDLHLAAILFNDNDEVLLMTRGDKKSSPKKLDFGCTNLRDGEKIEDILRKYYQNLGESIELDFFKDEVTDKPIPIALYEYEKNGKVINGLLFTGRVTQYEELKQDFDEYSKVEFYSVDMIKDLDLFSDSLENINKSIKIICKEKKC